MPRSIPIKNEPITEIDIHFFSNASVDEVCTVAYAVDYQPNKYIDTATRTYSRTHVPKVSRKLKVQSKKI